MFKTFLQNESYRLENMDNEQKAALLLRIYDKPCRVYKNAEGSVAIFDGEQYFIIGNQTYVTMLDSTYSVCNIEPAQDCDVLSGYTGEMACFNLTQRFVVDRKLIIPCFNPYYGTVECAGCRYTQFNGVLQIQSTEGVLSFRVGLVGSEIIFERIQPEHSRLQTSLSTN